MLRQINPADQCFDVIPTEPLKELGRMKRLNAVLKWVILIAGLSGDVTPARSTTLTIRHLATPQK